MTYALLDLVFLAVALAVLTAALWRRGDRRRLIARWSLPIVLAGLAVFALTAVFDNLMIAAGLMRYARGRLSGLAIGSVPLEDFAYPLAALILLPALWALFSRRARG